MKKLNKNEIDEILNDKEYLKFNGVMKQINDMHLNDDRSLDAIFIIVSNLILEKDKMNKKNIDTIQELVNIIREAIKYVEDSEFININKLLSILYKYKENNYDVK